MTDRARDRATARPSVVVLDVNETLSDMGPLAGRFEAVGAPAHLATSWFAGVLRDGFALAATGANEAFATLAEESLRVLLHGRPLDRGTDEAARHVMEGFTDLSVHPDVPGGVRALAEAGFRLVTLSNGAASVAEGLLDREDLRHHVEAVLSVEDAPAWKPAPSSYAYALERCGVAAGEAVLVAVHPWDVDGAARAGLSTAWLNRDGAPYPGYFKTPDVSVGSLTELAGALSR